VTDEERFLRFMDASRKGRIYRGGADIPWTRAKTHCKHGHPLSGSNLSKYTKGRVCLTCLRSRWIPRKVKAARKEQDAK
jgi:hypothetical protein